jgi:uncharacterized protein (DUF2384 family)
MAAASVAPIEQSDIAGVRNTLASTQTNSEVTEFPPPARLMSMSVHAGEVFANQEKAMHWLRSPNPSLEGKTPLEAAQTDKGYQDVEEVLVRIEHCVPG